MSFILLLILFLACVVFFAKNMWRTGSVLLLLSTSLTIFVGNGYFPKMLLTRLQTRSPLVHPEWKNQNVILLLGGGTVQWAEPHVVGSTIIAHSRVHEAARLYLDCKSKAEHCSILASGGDPQKNGISEAEVMRRELKEIGIPDEGIILEPKSNNTFQNAQSSNAIIQARKFDQIVIVTSGAHMSRSLLYFSFFHINAIPSPSDQLNAVMTRLPFSLNFLLADVGLHEFTGILRFHIYNKLGWNKASTQPGAP